MLKRRSVSGDFPFDELLGSATEVVVFPLFLFSYDMRACYAQNRRTGSQRAPTGTNTLAPPTLLTTYW